MADYYTWLCGFPFSQFVEEQFEVTHHSHRPLPTLLHPCRFGHLEQTQRHRLVIEYMDLYQTSALFSADSIHRVTIWGPKTTKAFVSLTHPDVPFICSTNTPLRVDTQRALGLVQGHGTHSRSLVRTCYMAGEVTYWTRRQRETRWTNERFDWSSIRS